MAQAGHTGQHDRHTGQDTGDYEYDLAHEEIAEPTSGGEQPAEPRPPVMPPDEGDGDYSYDLAHDIPPARPPEA